MNPNISRATDVLADPICPICDGTAFIPHSSSGRLHGALLPECETCGSLERHRAVYRVYQPLVSLLKTRRCLQFSSDVSVAGEWFGEFEVSQFGHSNSLDVMHIDRPNSCYDWVVLNHVLEHVADDLKALDELGRISKPSGVVQINIPTPNNRFQTKDWGFTNPDDHGHYRRYGSDFPDRIRRSTFRCYAIQTVASDPVTDWKEVVYFLSRDIDLLENIGHRQIKDGLIALRAV